MKNLINLSEILGTIEDGAIEVCASATADYDAAAAKVTVTLDAFARPSVPAGPNGHAPAPWLPKAESVTEHLPREEADAFTHDVFGNWVRRVRSSVPAEMMLRA